MFSCDGFHASLDMLLLPSLETISDVLPLDIVFALLPGPAVDALCTLFGSGDGSKGAHCLVGGELQ